LSETQKIQDNHQYLVNKGFHQACCLSSCWLYFIMPLDCPPLQAEVTASPGLSVEGDGRGKSIATG
jgi:hypothetical protein